MEPLSLYVPAGMEQKLFRSTLGIDIGAMLHCMTFDPQVGDIVCDCRFKHLKVIARDGDDLILEDGANCSLKHCCDDPNHDWPHPDAIAVASRLRDLLSGTEGSSQC